MIHTIDKYGEVLLSKEYVTEMFFHAIGECRQNQVKMVSIFTTECRSHTCRIVCVWYIIWHGTSELLLNTSVINIKKYSFDLVHYMNKCLIYYWYMIDKNRYDW